MSLAFTHKPDYFLFAQLMIHHIQDYLQKHPDTNDANFELRDVYELFRHDMASATINLDGIMNIVDEYQVETLDGDQKLIRRYTIHAKENNLQIDFDPAAVTALRNGRQIIPPDASLHE
jgi:hypothetical protein